MKESTSADYESIDSEDERSRKDTRSPREQSDDIGEWHVTPEAARSSGKCGLVNFNTFREQCEGARIQFMSFDLDDGTAPLFVEIEGEIDDGTEYDLSLTVDVTADQAHALASMFDEVAEALRAGDRDE